LPSENLSRRSHTRVKKWLDEKQQRATTKGTQPDRIVSDAPEQGQPSRLQSYATVVKSVPKRPEFPTMVTFSVLAMPRLCSLTSQRAAR
jgi:hypothetical protein